MHNRFVYTHAFELKIRANNSCYYSLHVYRFLPRFDEFGESRFPHRALDSREGSPPLTHFCTKRLSVSARSFIKPIRMTFIL
jgi:hypothetical protein